MRIGILTFHRANNYGAFLQALALKYYLESLGHQVEMVDYWPEGHADIYRLFPHSWKHRPFLGKIKGLISIVLRFNREKKRIDGMQRLVSLHFGLSGTPRYVTPESLRRLSYDCIVYGSDQIWWKSLIPGYEGFDPVYWGEYISTSVRKIAYAPSMGIIQLTQDDEERIKKWLGNFDVLSVRESSLYEAIHKLTDKKVSVVLDPVFLLSKNEWSKYCYPIKREKYILYYNLLPSKEGDTLVKKLKQKWGYKVVEITGSVCLKKLGARYVQTADAFDFISLIKNAEFVVTSSFHGTAFSIIFEKQFYATGFGNRAGRVESLLSQLNIVERLIRDINYLPVEKINYTVVSKALFMHLHQSKSYLEQYFT